MNQHRKDTLSSRTEELEKTLLHSIRVAKEKLQKFEQLENSAHRRNDRSVDAKSAFSIDTQSKSIIIPSIPPVPPNPGLISFRGEPKSAAKSQNEKGQQFYIRKAEMPPRMQQKPSEALVKAVRSLKKKVQQLQADKTSLQLQKAEILSSVESAAKKNSSSQHQNTILRDQITYLQEQLQSKTRQTSSLKQSIKNSPATESHHSQTQSQSQSHHTQTHTINIDSGVQVELTPVSQKYNESQSLRKCQVDLLDQLEVYEKRLKKNNKALAHNQNALRAAQLKLHTYRSVFNDLKQKVNKAPSALQSGVRLALNRVNRVDDQFDEHIRHAKLRNNRSNSMSRSGSKSRERSTKKPRNEHLKYYRSRGDMHLKTDRSENPSFSRSRSSSHNSFTNSALKKKLSNKKTKRMIIDDLRGEKESLLENDIVRLQANIEGLRKQSQKCHTELARASSTERQRIRVKLNDLTMQVGEQLQILRKLKKEQRLK